MMTAEHALAYPAHFEQLDGEVVVSFPDLPEALTGGADMDEAIEQAADCLEVAMSYRIRNDKDLPSPSKRRAVRGWRVVCVPSQTAVKAALYLALRESGTSKSALARSLGVDAKEIRRMLDPTKATAPKRIDAALRVLGCELQVTLGPIAAAKSEAKTAKRKAARRPASKRRKAKREAA
jgi:antitoxin HicB